MANKLENPQNAHHSHLILLLSSVVLTSLAPGTQSVTSQSLFVNSVESYYSPHQSNDLSSLANDGKVLEPLQDERDVERADRHKVNQVHRLLYKPENETHQY